VGDLPTWPWTFWIIFFGFLALLVFVILIVLYLTLLERKLLGWIQIRLGPNRVGPWGLLQPFADMIKLLIKEDIVPWAADKWLHLIAPLMIFIPTLLAFVVIPFGAGTVALPQDLVAPTFDSMWVEWVPPKEALERDLPSQGWIEAGVTIETDEDFHKTWWVKRELDHGPLFVPADEDGIPLPVIDKNGREFNRYRFPEYKTYRLQIKPDVATAKPEYAEYARMIDYGTPGRRYDVLEVRFGGSRGHKGVVELGLNGEQIDSVEQEFAKIVEGTGPDLAPEERYDFGDRPPKRVLEDLFSSFADSVAINNRRFAAASMVPAFVLPDGVGKTSWRDVYSHDWKHVCYIHGAVDRNEEKGSLYFFPALRAGEAAGEQLEIDFETLDWRSAGTSFRVQRITDGGYRIETAEGAVTELRDSGDSAQVRIDEEPVTVTLKDTQYYTLYIMGKDLGVGILYLMAVTSLSVLGIFMAGFAGNNKWSLIGATRSVAQLMSYEIPMTLAVLGPVLMTGAISTVELVEGQRSSWYVIPQFLAFYIFLVCMTAEINRCPFDLPEAESELVAGFHTEYTGLKFGFFFLAEYANMFVAAAVMTVLFFGGWKGPEIPFLGEFISSFFWFMLKTFFWLCVFIWFRGTFPRFRIDQMMDYAWKVLVPLSLANVVLTGYFAFSDWHFTIWKENNWRIWEDYIRPLFVNVYTSYYAIPAIVIVALLLLSDTVGLYRDRRRAPRL
jgi:NADH:ubiquinone oxidoreductase subunit H